MGLPLLFAHGPRPQTFLQAAAWPRKLFLWASEGDVRDPRAPPSNPREQTQAPACHVKQPPPPSKPYCVGITPALAKQRPQLGSESFFYAAAWPRKLFLWASEGNVRDPRAPPSNPREQTQAPACHVKQPPPPSKPYCVGITPALAKQRPQLGSESFFYAAAWPRKLFLWASEGNVRDPRAPPSNPPRQPAGLPRPLCGLSEACPFSSPTGPARKRSCRPQLGPESFFYGLPKATLETHGPRPQTLEILGSRQACRGLSVACPKPAPSPPTGPARKRSCRPQLGPESFFYGLPKATLETHGPRPQTLLGSRQACRGLSVACPKPAPSLRPPAPPANVPAGRSLAQKACSMGLPLLFAHGPRPQTFLQAAAWPRKLFLWASEGDVRDPRAPPSNPREQTQAPACHVKQPPPPSKPYCVGITPALAKQRPQLGSESFFYAAAWPRKLFLWASEGNVRDPRAPPPNPSRLRSCRPQLGSESFFYGLPKATLETHGPRPQTPLGSWQACLLACPRQRKPQHATLSSHPAFKALLRRHHSCTGQTKAAAWLRKLFLCRSLAQKAFSMGFRRQR